MCKIIFCIVVWALTSMACFADNLELSDVIKQARSMQQRQNVKDDSVMQVKNNTQDTLADAEKNACEKINMEEILQSAQNDCQN